jgi:long-chain acyl-CoA synthetase
MAGEIRSGGRTLTLTQVQERAARAAAGFRSLGLKEGDTVALLLRNDLSLFEASLAAQQLGAFATPINWHGKPEEIGYILADCGARVLVAHADLLAGAAGVIPPGVTVFAATTPREVGEAYGLTPSACRVPGHVTEWNGWLEGFAPRTEPPAALRASMIYTSGTTGRPKGVRRQPSAGAYLERRFLALRECWGFVPEMRCAITGPMYHSAPNAYALAAVNFDATIVLQPRFDAEDLLALIQEHRLTHMHIVPTMFVRLLRLPEAVRRRYDVSSLRWLIHGAAPCPREIKKAMIEWWGPVIYEYYGSTEGGVITCAGSRDWLDRPGTVGRPTSLVHVRVLDDEGRPVPAGVSGTIYSRNEAIPDFTYHALDAKRREIDREGFITSGDIGYLDADGYLFLNDRKIDMVISGGVNIYPAEIEAALLQMPGVQDCAVFGIPDEEFGETVAAAVQAVPGARLTPEAVQAHVRQHLADFKVPRVIEFLTDLPREDSGKIFKRKLREPYWKNAGRSI